MTMQLDIFNDSRDLMLRNDVLDAVEREAPNTAREAWQRLEAEYPGDEALPPAMRLIEVLPGGEQVPFRHHADLAHARSTLDDEIRPAAQRLLESHKSSAWLRRRWRELAERASGLPYHADHPDDHAVALWLHAGEWRAAIDAVQRIESWRRIPAPLAWMAEARAQADGLDPSWGLLAELAWLAPARFDRLCTRLEDPRLHKLLGRFDASFEADESGRAWFPAWLLTEDTRLAHWLERAERSLDTVPEQAMRTLLELLRLERQGRQHDIVDRRRTLKALNPELFDAYKKTR